MISRANDSQAWRPAWARCAAWVSLAAAFLCAPGVSAAPPAGYYLVWADEFSGSSLDTAKWNYWLPGARRDAINTSNAVSVGGGNLVITTYTTNATHYTGMIASDTKFRSKFGYWEASIDWNDAPGMWSAYWMQSPTMGADIADPVTSGSEIDIAEHRLIDGSSNSIANQVQVNIHWNGYGASHQSQGSGNVGSGLGSGFHTYGFKWTSGGYDFTIDGASKWTGGSSPVSRSTEWMILSSEVDDTSTTWAGSIPAAGYGNLLTSTTKMTVDYVRYYAPTNTLFWMGTNSAFWTNAANWVSNKVPTTASDLTFSYLSTANLASQLGANFSVDSLTVLETTSSFSVSGTNTLTLGAGGVDMISLSRDAAFNCPVVMGAGQTWTIGSGRKLTVNSNLSGTGVLTKAGKGTLVVGVSNTISKSILATNGFIGVSAGASNQFAFTATGAGGVKAFVGASPGRCATLNLTNASLDFDFGTVTGTPGVGLIAGTVNLSGTNDVNITGSDLPVTNLTLLTYTTKTGTGVFQLGTLPAGAAATLTDNGSSLVLNIAVWPQVLTWSGAASGTWNTNGATLDWDAGAKAYHEYTTTTDSVVFDDSAADFSVTLSHNVSPASVTVDNDTNAYTFSFPGKISGATTLVKRGTNTLTLNTTNNFTGDITINEGRVVVGPTGALYSFASGNKITINNGATLSVQGNIGWQSKALGRLNVQAAGLVLNGGVLQHTGTGNAKTSDGAGHLFTVGASGATLESATAGQTFSIGYRYDYSATLASSSGGTLELKGVGHGDLNYGLPGSGGLTKNGTGTWTLSGTNSYTGPTTVNTGTLSLADTELISASSDLIVNGGAFDLNGFTETLGDVTLDGGSITNTGGSSAEYLAGTSYTMQSGRVSTRLAGLGALVKTGAGTVTLSGSNTFLGGSTVSNGTLVLTGSLNSFVTVAGGTFSGTGTVNSDVNVNSGVLAPGLSPGVLTVKSNLTLGAGGILQIEINGTAPGSGHDQVKLTNASSVITLAGDLTILATNGLATNSTFVVITNSGSAAVSGTFVGKPQGFMFFASGYWWRVSYTGGSGNDVTLTIVAPPATPLVTPGLFSNGFAQLTVMGDSNLAYQLQATTNFSNWTTLLTTNASALPFNWTDTNAGSFLKRFYRVLLGP